MEGFLPDDQEQFGRFFPVKLSAVTNSGGTYYYSGNEQVCNFTGSYANSSPGRAFANTGGSLLVEVNNQQLNTVANTVVLARLRGAKPDGTYIYEFVQGGAAASSSSAFSGARVYNNSSISCTDTTPTALACDAEIVDTGGYHDNVTNNDRLVAPATGYYAFGMTVQWPYQTATKWFSISITSSGGDVISSTAGPCFANSGLGTLPLIQSCSGIAQLTAGGYVSASVRQYSGATVTISGGAGYSEFWIYLIGT